MTETQMWQAYSAEYHIEADHEAWAYGDAADKLAQLTLDGVKTATASAEILYRLEGEPLPEAGEYSVILDSREEAVCIIQTTKVYVVPFSQVSEEQAWKERGIEALHIGDRSTEISLKAN